KRDANRERWWQYAEKRPGLYAAIQHFSRVLAIARMSRTCAFTFVSAKQILNEKIVVLTFDSNPAFALLQSRVHEVWTRFLSTTLKDDLQYTPSECFETFPFPVNWDRNQKLEEIGAKYFGLRARIMINDDLGLTSIYDRFNLPDTTNSPILEL